MTSEKKTMRRNGKGKLQISLLYKSPEGILPRQGYRKARKRIPMGAMLR
jgi:hypothetical protein